MDATFRAGDETLAQLVSARREEVVQLQTDESDRLQNMEKRGQRQIKALRKNLSEDISSMLTGLDSASRESAEASTSNIDSVKARLIESAPSTKNETAVHPGLAGGRLIAPSSLGWFQPYYGTLHWSDGTVIWQGYNPGNITVWDSASGSGPGWFGTGAASATIFMDWWFYYTAPQDQNYNNTIYVPFHGFYILHADDGFWTSYEASASINLAATGYQYNYKPTATTNVFSMDSQNINVNDRFDGWRTMYYSDLLGADTAYLLVSASFYVYARGDGSYAELNFADGTANYLGVPWVYVD
jgi:hypothetical protein